MDWLPRKSSGGGQIQFISDQKPQGRLCRFPLDSGGGGEVEVEYAEETESMAVPVSASLFAPCTGPVVPASRPNTYSLAACCGQGLTS